MRKPVVITTAMPTIEQVARTYGLTASDIQDLREFLFSKGHLKSPDDPTRQRKSVRVPRASFKRRKS